MAEGVDRAFRVGEIGRRWRQTARPTCRATRRHGRARPCPCRRRTPRCRRRRRPPRCPWRDPIAPRARRAACRLDRCPPPGPASGSRRARSPPEAAPTSGGRRHRARQCRPNPTCPTDIRQSARGADSPWEAGPCESCAKIAGSLFLIQASFGAVKPGNTMLPVSARKRGSASSSAASAWLRVSFHRMQGRSTWSSASSTVAPCMWPDSPMPLTAENCFGCWRAVRPSRCSVAEIQSAGIPVRTSRDGVARLRYERWPIRRRTGRRDEQHLDARRAEIDPEIHRLPSRPLRRSAARCPPHTACNGGGSSRRSFITKFGAKPTAKNHLSGKLVTLARVHALSSRAQTAARDARTAPRAGLPDALHIAWQARSRAMSISPARSAASMQRQVDHVALRVAAAEAMRDWRDRAKQPHGLVVSSPRRKPGSRARRGDRRHA